MVAASHSTDSGIIAHGHRNRWPREIYNIYVKLQRGAREDFRVCRIRGCWILSSVYRPHNTRVFFPPKT